MAFQALLVTTALLHIAAAQQPQSVSLTRSHENAILRGPQPATSQVLVPIEEPKLLVPLEEPRLLVPMEKPKLLVPPEKPQLPVMIAGIISLPGERHCRQITDSGVCGHRE
jgi:hypothetical protein